jgi:competence protein ComEC
MRRPVVAALALVACLVCLAAFWGFGRHRRPSVKAGVATLEFLDVGQGDAILIRSPEGKTALVDAGPSNRIVEQLRERGITSLDLVVVSHHHIDHYGGMGEVVREFHPRVFLDADSPHVTVNYLALLKRVKDERITAIRAGPKARKIELGSVTLTVFPQAPTNEKDENNNSIGLRVNFGAFSALLPGDAEGPERRWWIRHAPELCADVDVLKLAHHGSRNGTDSAWLGLTRPKLAVASLAAGNDFGHPHPETVALLRSQEIPLRRTDESGSIAIETDGLTWSLERAPPSADDGTDRSSRRAIRKGVVRINSSSESELRTLPGIGRVMAARIIEGRPYRSIDDLSAIPSLGKKRIEQIRPFVTVE